jgi:hypothetical protein
MHTPQYKELQKAAEFLRNSLGNAKSELDYSTYSIKSLDFILSEGFRDGKVRNPTGTFAKHQGMIMLGIAGYLTDVILKNTTNTKVEIDPSDEKWYLNFKLVAANGLSIQPAQQIIKRSQLGRAAELYAYSISTIKEFNQSK